MIINDDTLDADEMRAGGTGLVPFLIRKWFWLSVHDFRDGKWVIIRPIGKVYEDSAGCYRHADAGNLLAREAGNLLQFSRSR